MKKGTIVTSGLLALALAGAGIAGGAEARPAGGERHGADYGHHHPGHGMSRERHDGMTHRLFERLDLSEEQRETIRAIREARAPEIRDKAAALREISRELHGIALRGDFDEHQARELATRRAELQAELQVQRMIGMHEAWQVLTDEQKARLAEWRERHGDRMHREHKPQREGHRPHRHG
jgi:Spy/CpxP family protein refolding chaperone